MCLCFFFFNDTATTEIYTLSLHDALPILACSFVSSASRFCSRALPFSSKTLASFSIASRFQAAIWVGCSSYLVASSATVWWPLIASSATLALNSAENRLRVLMVDRPLRRQIHLNRLSQEVGPPLIPLNLNVM